MPNIYSPAELSALLRAHNLAPLKSLGQNFLIDQNIVEKIAAAAVEPGGNVLEVGPGPGALTLQLARRAGRVVAVEIDRGMLGVLQETLAGQDHVQVLHADFLKIDLAKVAREYFDGQPFAVAGNLPYYITAKCLLKVLESPALPTRFTAMVQQEVAARLTARPGDKNYGAITASAAYYGGAEVLFPVGRGCFLPAPEVDSAIVQFRPRVCVAAERDEKCPAAWEGMGCLFPQTEGQTIHEYEKRAEPRRFRSLVVRTYFQATSARPSSAYRMAVLCISSASTAAKYSAKLENRSLACSFTA